MLHCVTITRFVAPRHVIVIGTDTSSLTLVTPQVSHYRPIFGLYTTWSTDCHACSLLLEMCPCRGCFSLVWLHRWFVYDTAGQRFRVMCPLLQVPPCYSFLWCCTRMHACTGPHKRMHVCLCECRQCIRVCCMRVDPRLCRRQHKQS